MMLDRADRAAQLGEAPQPADGGIAGIDALGRRDRRACGGRGRDGTRCCSPAPRRAFSASSAFSTATMSTSPSRWSDSWKLQAVAPRAWSRADARKRCAGRSARPSRAGRCPARTPRTAGAKADAVRLRRHGIEQRLVVRGGRGDARQAEQRARRIVGMQRQRDAELLGHRRDGVEKLDEMPAQHRFGVDAAIGCEPVAECRDGQRLGGRARQRAGDGA